MQKAWVLLLIAAIAAPASAVELRLRESAGVGMLLAEDHVQPGLFFDNAVIFDFNDHWSLDVNYFGTAGVGADRDAMMAEAIAVEEPRITDAVNATGNVNGTFSAAGLLSAADFARFETFTSQVFWGGASVAYRGGDPDGMAFDVGLGGIFYSVPNIGYDYKVSTNVEYEAVVEEEVVETSLPYASSPAIRVIDEENPDLLGGVHSVLEASGPGVRARFGVAWAVGEIFQLTADASYMTGFGDPGMSMAALGAGVNLRLP